jgi:hypothetical protein
MTGTAVCAMTTPVDAVTNCLWTATNSTIEMRTNTGTYNPSSTYTGTFSMSSGGITNPTVPGEYGIEVWIRENGVTMRHQTVLLTINPSALAGLSVTTLTTDVQRPTLMKIKFTIPQAFPSGVVTTDPTIAQSQIKIILETFGSGVNQYSNTLGTGSLATQSLPCYGINNIYRNIHRVFLDRVHSCVIPRGSHMHDVSISRSRSWYPSYHYFDRIPAYVPISPWEMNP